MAKKKLPKYVSILLITIGLVLVFFIAAIGIMFFLPGTSILGFQYVSYTTPLTRTYTASSPISILNLKAVKIITDQSAVYVEAGANDSQISVNFNRKIYGFVKNQNSALIYKDDIVSDQTFEEDVAGYKTLVINISEPSGLIATGDSFVKVFLPSDISFDIIYLSSDHGALNYNSFANEKTITAKNLYLTSTDKDIFINNTQPCDNYYLKTSSGKVQFQNSTVTAKKLKFESTSGSLNFTNSSSDATLNLQNGMIVKSTGNVSVFVNTLLGDLNIDAKVGGMFYFNNIGASGSYKIVTVHSISSTLHFGTLYGALNVSGNENVEKNTVSVTKLVSGNGATSTINSGSGAVNIEEADAEILSVSSTSGYISLRKLSVDTSLNIYSLSGAISISYIEDNTSHPNTIIKVFTQFGNISLSNISAFYEIEVLENSGTARLDIVLSAVCHDAGNTRDNIILARNRNVNLTLKGYQNDLICRILSQKPMFFADSSTTQVEADDYDYILDNSDYENYDYEYRVGYNKPENEVGAIYEGKGKVLVEGSGTVTINFQID